MNHSLLVVLKRAGEVVLTAKGHPALTISIGIAAGVITVARALARYRDGGTS